MPLCAVQHESDYQSFPTTQLWCPFHSHRSLSLHSCGSSSEISHLQDMANIPDLSLSAVTGKNELQLALANINLNFFFLKAVIAPKEYQPPGQALSLLRRENAESGTVLRTARKLGLLFEQAVKPNEQLVKAYGERASEIISSFHKTQPTLPHKFGFFKKYKGSDGTAIWAAATTSTSAISVVLLACMLARLWDAPKATSVWWEVVKGRKRCVAGLERLPSNRRS
ncbi:hypothetical protein F5Y17DRAFT_436309 [Xylariaceae sp. FL0594]|nr:hypothetical protein F5Y17DRAFT_436309 [Xylariaceae sp. FL0594]